MDIFFFAQLLSLKIRIRKKNVGVISINTEEEMSKCTIQSDHCTTNSNTKMVMPDIRRANQLIAVESVTFLGNFCFITSENVSAITVVVLFDETTSQPCYYIVSTADNNGAIKPQRTSSIILLNLFRKSLNSTMKFQIKVKRIPRIN